MDLGQGHTSLCLSGEEPGWLLPGVGSCLQLRWQTRPQQAPGVHSGPPQPPVSSSQAQRPSPTPCGQPSGVPGPHCITLHSTVAPPLSSASLCPLTGMFCRHMSPRRPCPRSFLVVHCGTLHPLPYSVGFPSTALRLCAFVCSPVPCELPESQAAFHVSSAPGLLRSRHSPFMGRRTKDLESIFIFSCCVWNGLKQHRFIRAQLCSLGIQEGSAGPLLRASQGRVQGAVQAPQSWEAGASFPAVCRWGSFCSEGRPCAPLL